MRILFDRNLERKLKKIKKRNPQLFAKIQTKLELFEKSPFHPTLRRHSLAGNLSGYWSISIDYSIRMIFVEDGMEVYFIEVGKHDDVYRKST